MNIIGIKIYNCERLCIIDKEDFELVSQFKWRKATRGIQTSYKDVTGRWKYIYIHRLITGFKFKMVDHKNRDIFDNRKCNLRKATNSQNQANALARPKWKKGIKSLYKGICLREYSKGNKWVAYIQVENMRYTIGKFDTDIEAAKAYDEAAKNLFGEFALLNFPSACAGIPNLPTLVPATYESLTKKN